MSTVSVVLTSYQGAPFLPAAFASVVNQTYPPAEVIVVDDGSTDGSVEWLRQTPGLRLLEHARQGVGAARNAGVRHAQGEYVAFLDGDDEWHHEKLRRQLEAIAGMEGPVISLAHQMFFWAPGFQPPDWVRPELLHTPHPSYVPGALLAHRSCFEVVGGFDEDLPFGNDTDWLARARDAGVRSVTVPDVLLRKRIHGTNSSGHVSHNLHDIRTLLRASIRRKHRS